MIEKPNQQQIETFVRWLLTAGGPLGSILISRGTNADTLNQITTLAVALAPPLVALVWGLLSRRDASMVAAVGKIEGTKVLVDTDAASPAVAAVAENRTKDHDVIPKEDYRP